jgi:hypothetical protein
MPSLGEKGAGGPKCVESLGGVKSLLSVFARMLGLSFVLRQFRIRHPLGNEIELLVSTTVHCVAILSSDVVIPLVVVCDMLGI